MQRVWSLYLAQSSESGHGPSRESASLVGPSVYKLPHQRTSSVFSQTNSVVSTQRNILDSQDFIMPPLGSPAPFAKLAPSESLSGTLKRSSLPLPSANSSTTDLLSVNFLPSKFSHPQPGGLHKRKGKGGKLTVPKNGGGREAFKNREARMPEGKDEDYDGVDINHGSWKSAAPLRWNRFKWILFCTNLMVTAYSLAALVVCLLTWFNVWKNADIIRVGNETILVLSTVASSVGLLSSLVGWAGILLNNRGFLATYTLLLWVTFALICAPGYVAYKTRTFNLEGKLNAQWSQSIGEEGRLRIQNQLHCCGYYSPFVEATVSQLCYARSILPGCKNAYLKFERTTLARWYGIAFGLVPLHLLVILAGLLCSNHITYRFGKGMMPKAYRLNMSSMAVIIDGYANQLSEHYGKGVASELLTRSRSNLQSDCIPNGQYASLKRISDDEVKKL